MGSPTAQSFPLSWNTPAARSLVGKAVNMFPEKAVVARLSGSPNSVRHLSCKFHLRRLVFRVFWVAKPTKRAKHLSRMDQWEVALRLQHEGFLFAQSCRIVTIRLFVRSLFAALAWTSSKCPDNNCLYHTLAHFAGGTADTMREVLCKETLLSCCCWAAVLLVVWAAGLLVAIRQNNSYDLGRSS